MRLRWPPCSPNRGPTSDRNGRLTVRNTEPAFAAKRRLLEETTARLHTTLDALALAAVLAQPWADVRSERTADGAQYRARVRREATPAGRDDRATAHNVRCACAGRRARPTVGRRPIGTDG